ncbi:EamA family transporter, partial [Citrobacter amalonaticus]|nr:EamA family transporter [Citrobacter amalonaticus]
MNKKVLVVQIALVMTAFAANSVLCRIALKNEHIDPVTFTNLRLASGAIVLLPMLARGNVFSKEIWQIKNGMYL